MQAPSEAETSRLDIRMRGSVRVSREAWDPGDKLRLAVNTTKDVMAQRTPEDSLRGEEGLRKPRGVWKLGSPSIHGWELQAD